MNTEETARILSTVAVVYPSIRDRDFRLLTQIWQQVFAAVPYEQVNRALGAFLASDTKGFPPTPGALNAYIRGPTENQAWAMLFRAVSRGLYNSAEEYAKLPEDIREIVGSPQMLYEWSQLSTGEMNTVIAPGFRRSWRARQELKREMAPFLRLEEAESPRLEEGRGTKNND